MSENENHNGWRWLLPISLVADVSAVLTVLSGSASTATLVIGVVALLIGMGLVLARIGKPVDKVVLLAVVGIVAGTAAVSVVTTRAFTSVPTSGAGPSTSSPAATADSSTTPTTTPSSARPPAAPGVRRESKDKPIQLTTDYGVDLDSDALDWGSARSSSPEASRHDVNYDGSYLWAAKDLAPAKADATLDDCIRAGYKRYATYEEVVPDATFCVKTNGKSFARVRLAKVDRGDVLGLDVLVWAPKD